VLRDHLVLVCPACQQSADWTAELDRCRGCGSVHLIRRLDQLECLDCGLVRDPAPVQAASAQAGAPDLAEEVSRALDRVLGRR
jgi:hypothetical protein